METILFFVRECVKLTQLKFNKMYTINKKIYKNNNKKIYKINNIKLYWKYLETVK